MKGVPRTYWRTLPRALPADFRVWLESFGPLTVASLAKSETRFWGLRDEAGLWHGAMGLRYQSLVYPIFPRDLVATERAGLRRLLLRLKPEFCVLGPPNWGRIAQSALPAAKNLRAVDYDFFARPALVCQPEVGAGEIRLATVDQVPFLFELQAAYEKEEVVFEPQDFLPEVSRLHFEQAVREERILALWLNGKPIAKAGTNACSRNWAQWGGVFTRPEYRRQGFQRRLLQVLINQLAQEGLGSCLFVKLTNPAAQRLYRQLGFVWWSDYQISYWRRQAEGFFRPRDSGKIN